LGKEHTDARPNDRHFMDNIAVLRTCRGVSNVRLWLEGGIGFGIVSGLTLAEPLVKLAGVGVDRAFFQVLVAPYGKPFGLFPSLHGPNFPANVGCDLFPRRQLLVMKGRALRSRGEFQFPSFQGESLN